MAMENNFGLMDLFMKAISVMEWHPVSEY